MAEKINELNITRIFDASPELVFSAWTDSKHYSKWMAPKDFEVPFCSIDLRLGGSYKLCMRGKDGKDFWSTGIYTEIAENERLVCTDCFADENGNIVTGAHYGMPGNWRPEMLFIINFEPVGGKTKMKLRHIGLPDGMMSEMTSTGWNECLDKLEALLKQM